MLCSWQRRAPPAQAMMGFLVLYLRRFEYFICCPLPRSRLQPHITLRVHLPATYPSQHPPVFELSCDILSGGQLGELAAELEALFAPGALFSWGCCILAGHRVLPDTEERCVWLLPLPPC